MRLVFVHGRAQGGKDPTDLLLGWIESFDVGLKLAGLTRPPNLDIAFPFYADHLDELVKKKSSPAPGEIHQKGSVASAPELEFQLEFLEEVVAEEGVTPQYVGGPQEKGPLNWGWVQSMLQALDEEESLGYWSLQQFTRDVSIYLTHDDVRETVNAYVNAQLKDPCVVVGHSLGSVVSYDVLTKSSLPPKSVRRFITLGSPLGVKAVKRRLDSPLRSPPCAKDWFNAFDDRDVVALFPLDATHFGVQPPIENKSDVKNFTDNRHGIAGYLCDPVVAKKIYEALTS